MQQAARYLRGLGDGIPSHATVSMLLPLLILSIKECLCKHFEDDDVSDDEEPIEEEDAHIENPNDEDELEDVHIRVATNEDSQVVECNQIHHYIYCLQLLADMCFYEVCCCVQLQTKAQSKDIKNTYGT
jgi:hypothetical protein